MNNSKFLGNRFGNPNVKYMSLGLVGVILGTPGIIPSATTVSDSLDARVKLLTATVNNDLFDPTVQQYRYHVDDGIIVYAMSFL